MPGGKRKQSLEERLRAVRPVDPAASDAPSEEPSVEATPTAETLAEEPVAETRVEPEFEAAFNACFEALLEQHAEPHAGPETEAPSEPAVAVLVDVPVPLLASLQEAEPEQEPAALAASTALDLAAPHDGSRDFDQGVPGHRPPSPPRATDHELAAVHDQLEALRTSATEGDTFLPAGSSTPSVASAPAPRRIRSRAAAPTAEAAPPVVATPETVAAPSSSAMPVEATAPALVPVDSASAPVDDVPMAQVDEPSAAAAPPPPASTSFLDRFSRRGSRTAPKRTSEPAPADVEAAIKPFTEPVFETLAAPMVEPHSRWAAPAGAEQFGRIGSALITRGLITSDQLDAALELQRSTGRRIGDSLVDMGVISPFDLVRVLADHMGVPFVDLKAKAPDSMLATLLPEEVARRYDALPFARWNDQLVIAMANPTDLFALDDLQLVTRQSIIPAMALQDDLRAAIDRTYHVSQVETTLDAATIDYAPAPEAFAPGLADVNEAPVVRLVNALLDQAITDHASDLHVEPNSTHIAIRYRVDGVLHDASEVPLSLLRPLVSRLKILANLDIAQTRLAQDGRFSLSLHERPVDVRVVTVPTAAGESVILRLLDPTRDAFDSSNLHLTPAERARFMPAFRASQGAAFVTGPTGSGKTSTIYGVLSEINTRSKSIISVEDPVEYRLDGVKQMQINARVGVTFPNALPSVLRSDPDIVFIGEVRDSETARIAADAAITGHLVLSTLHATRAAAAPMRLIDMGVEPYLVAAALTLVAAQRLARTLCDACAEPMGDAGLDVLRQLGADDAIIEGATVRRAVGCPECRSGFRGRLPLFEIMPVTDSISRLILNRASRSEIEQLAVSEGMDTMRVAALRRVASGVLGVDEMMRVVS